MGFLASFGGPRGAWSGSGPVALLGQGTPGHGTTFASGTTRPFLDSFWVKMARKGDLPKKTADLRLGPVKTNKITPVAPPVEWNSLLGEGKK